MTTHPTTAIEADPVVPVIRMTRDFRATPAQLLRAHTDPELYRRWCGPDSAAITIDHWDARTGGAGGSVTGSMRSAAASTRSAPAASCRPSRGRARPIRWRWRR